MAKLNIFMLSLIGWIILFNLAGLVSGGTGYILGNLGITNPANFGNTTFYATLAAMFTITLAGVAIGSVVFKDASLVLLTTTVVIGGTMGLMGPDIIILFNNLVLTNASMALLITGPLIVVWIFTVVEWVRGMST